MLHNYSIGFVLSLVLTLAAFGSVALYLGGAPLSREMLIAAVVVLAITQLVVQMIFFLHLGGELRLWNIAGLLFGVLIIVLVVGGSLWIMANLEHNMAHESKFIGEPSPYTQLD